VILILLRHDPHAEQTGAQQQSTMVANIFWQHPRQIVKSLIAGVYIQIWVKAMIAKSQPQDKAIQMPQSVVNSL